MKKLIEIIKKALNQITLAEKIVIILMLIQILVALSK